MRRRLAVLMALGVMLGMMALSASAAFAFPTDPTHHGQRVSYVARSYPTDPVAPSAKGRAISDYAWGGEVIIGE